MTDMTPQEVRQLSPLALAYIGDCIYELLTRRHILARGNMPVNRLHRASVEIVRASAQSHAVGVIEPLLTEEELAIYKRGRNANGSQVPKNADPCDYRRATGLEALFGYLCLTGRNNRVEELYDRIYQEAVSAPFNASGSIGEGNACEQNQREKSSIGIEKEPGNVGG